MTLPMRTKRFPLPLLALLITSTPALGGEMYRWVDEQGVTNFSQTPPDDPAMLARVLHLEPLSTIAPVDVAALLEVAERLEASRLAREQARAAQRQATREAQLPEQPPPATTAYHPPVLLRSGYRKPPLLHPPITPIHDRPRQRPHHPARHPDLIPAVASGTPAHRPTHKAQAPWSGTQYPSRK